MTIRPRAFKVRTYEDSWFAVRFHPEVFWNGIPCGKMLVVGYSKTTGQEVFWEGVGAEPMVGGRIVVSSIPVEVEIIGDEKCPIYETETISFVKEVEIPEDILTDINLNCL